MKFVIILFPVSVGLGIFPKDFSDGFFPEVQRPISSQDLNETTTTTIGGTSLEDATTNATIAIEDLIFNASSSEYITISEKFSDYKHWSKKYPQCNPWKNPFPSPININTSNVIYNQRMKPIVVYAGSPTRNCYFLSSMYKSKELEMEVVTILPLPECETTITHIKGAGDKITRVERFFRRALLMYSTTDLDIPQSLHRIDGKIFQMEIAMEFVDYNQNELASTEIHVLVEAKSPDEVPENPIFKPLEIAIPLLKEEIIKEAQGETERAARYQKFEARCLTAKAEFSNVLSQHRNFSRYKARIDELNEILDSVGRITDREYRKLVKQKYDVDAHGPMNNTIDKILAELKRLEERKKELKAMLWEDTDQQVRKMLFETKGKIVILTRTLLNAKNGKSPHIKKSPEEKLRLVINDLKLNKIGIPGEPPYPGQLYDSPDALHQELETLQLKLSTVLESKKEKERICKEFEDFQRHAAYGFVPINEPFQISWMFPFSGGFYIYNGSDPIPRCERRKHSIVFKNPIQMTTAQLAAFQSIPSLLKLRREAKKGTPVTGVSNLQSDQLVDGMLPMMYEDEARKVFYVPKNPVYLSDDALHKMANPENRKNKSWLSFYNDPETREHLGGEGASEGKHVTNILLELGLIMLSTVVYFYPEIRCI